MQVGSKIRVIADSYPEVSGKGKELNTGGTGVVVGYVENPQGRTYAVKIDNYRECKLCPPDEWATAGTLQGGWAYDESEIVEVSAD